MDSAPKDHTDVLVTDGDYVYVAHWRDDLEYWTDGEYNLGDKGIVAWMPLPPITRTVKMRAKNGN